MADTTSALPSAAEPVVDRYRRWSPVWYPWIKKLLDTVRTSAEATFAIEETIDEIAGRWAIEISENGRVTGAVKLDGSETLSSFAVLADKFIVVHPSADGTTIQAFIVSGGSVGINGNLLVAGTVLAEALDVDTLSAITANVGTVTAGVLKSSDNNFVIDLNNKTLTIST